MNSYKEIRKCLLGKHYTIQSGILGFRLFFKSWLDLEIAYEALVKQFSIFDISKCKSKTIYIWKR